VANLYGFDFVAEYLYLVVNLWKLKWYYTIENCISLSENSDEFTIELLAITSHNCLAFSPTVYQSILCLFPLMNSISNISYCSRRYKLLGTLFPRFKVKPFYPTARNFLWFSKVLYKCHRMLTNKCRHTNELSIALIMWGYLSSRHWLVLFGLLSACVLYFQF